MSVNPFKEMSCARVTNSESFSIKYLCNILYWLKFLSIQKENPIFTLTSLQNFSIFTSIYLIIKNRIFFIYIQFFYYYKYY